MRSRPSRISRGSSQAKPWRMPCRRGRAHIGAGHDVMITLNYPGKEPQRFLARERGAEIAVPMYRACVAAAAAGVAPVQTGDGKLIFQMVDDERCGFRQWFSFDDFPVGLSLWVGNRGGEFTFARQTISGTPHGRTVKRRQQPDQVDAVSLFGGTWSRTCAGVWWRTRQALGGDDGGLPGGSFRSGRRTARRSARRSAGASLGGSGFHTSGAWRYG